MSAMTSQASWKIEVNGTEYGPYTHSELLRLQAEGRVDGDILGYDDKIGEWRRLADIEALRAMFVAKARP